MVAGGHGMPEIMLSIKYERGIPRQPKFPVRYRGYFGGWKDDLANETRRGRHP